MSGIVLYASKYGSTARYAGIIGESLGFPARPVENPGDGWAEADLIVLGSPIYGPAVLPAMTAFISANRDTLAGKKIAAFVVCGDTVWIPKAGEGGDVNLFKLTKLLPELPIDAAVLGGRLDIATLDDTDRPRIFSFYKRLGKEPVGFDRMDEQAARAFAGRVRATISIR